MRLTGKGFWKVRFDYIKENEVYVRVDTEPNIARELSDFFTFEVPGARFMPSYKKRIWDGKIRLYNMMNGEIYLGLIPYIQEFAKRNDIDIEYKGDVNATQSSFTHGVCKALSEISNLNPMENLLNSVTIRLMPLFMQSEIIGFYFLVLLLVVSH